MSATVLTLMEPSRIRIRRTVYRPYSGPEQPCAICAPNGSHKRGIFYDTRRHHYLCARCMVMRMGARREP